jgi:hypothetical protein
MRSPIFLDRFRNFVECGCERLDVLTLQRSDERLDQLLRQFLLFRLRGCGKASGPKSFLRRFFRS